MSFIIFSDFLLDSTKCILGNYKKHFLLEHTVTSCNCVKPTETTTTVDSVK